MKTYVLILGQTSVCITCGKTVTRTETNIPPEISPKFVHVDAVSDDRVRVSGSKGAIFPSGGLVSITNTSRGGDATETNVDDDGAFSTELPGRPEDVYELVATNDSGSSSVQIVSNSIVTSSNDWQTLHPCGDAGATDPLNVTDLEIEGDTVHLSVSHGGGCANHRYGLCFSDQWKETSGLPVRVGFRLLHDAGGDTCEALLHEDLTFDLRAFKSAYNETYNSENGSVLVEFDNCLLRDQTPRSCFVQYKWGEVEFDCGPPTGKECELIVIPDAPDYWIERQTECGFSFRAPDDLMEVDIQTIDSCGIEFENEHCTISAGSGPFSSELRGFAQNAEYYRYGQTTIDGLPAMIATATVVFEGWPPYIAAAYIPDPFAGEPGTIDVDVDMSISCGTPEERDAMLPILGTLLFN